MIAYRSSVPDTPFGRVDCTLRRFRDLIFWHKGRRQAPNGIHRQDEGHPRQSPGRRADATRRVFRLAVGGHAESADGCR